MLPFDYTCDTYFIPDFQNLEFLLTIIYFKIIKIINDFGSTALDSSSKMKVFPLAKESK